MEIVKAESTAHFLGFVPALVGGSVARSIVFVPFHGTRTFDTACRIDLPGRDRRADIRTVVHGAVSVLSRVRGADRVDVVVYTDRSFESERGIPYLELGRAAVEGLQRAGFHVGLAACVAADGWGEYLDRSHRSTGRPLDEIAGSAALVAASGDREVPDADPSARGKVARILGFEPSLPGEELVYFERALPLVDWCELVLTGYDESAIVAMGLALFESPAARDTALLYYAFGREVGEAADADARRLAEVQRATGESMDAIVEAEIAAGAPGGDLGVDLGFDLGFDRGFDLGDMLLGRTERVPDRARLGAAIRMLRALVAHAPDELRPGPLTMLGWCLWAVGSSAAAGAMLDRALAIAPDYRMAALLRTWIDSGAHPEWLFSRLG